MVWLPALLDGHVLTDMVRVANGWSGVALIFVYSVLIAVVLPLPSELVLVPVLHGTLRLFIPTPLAIVLVLLVSATGKALGSILALVLGHSASHSGPVLNAVRRLGFEPVTWSKQRIVTLVQQYGYTGLAIALSIPGFPDTISIYAFSVLDLDHDWFAAATFLGSLGRLLIVLLFLHGSIA